MADGISDKTVKACWELWGGSFHGPNVETATIEEKRMYSFARDMYRRGIATAMRLRGQSQSDRSAE